MMGEKVDRKPSQEELLRVCVHESGHALISELLENGSVTSLTIIPRGRALGFMRKAPRDDQYLYTQSELENQVMIALGGAVAEELRFGSRSTGAKNDFDQAWEVASEVVKSGLSSLGILSGNHIPAEQLYKECKEIINHLELKTRSLLENNQTLLYHLADIILEEESIDRIRLEEIIYSSNRVAV
jgi:vesicle-fusing ATPase